MEVIEEYKLKIMSKLTCNNIIKYLIEGIAVAIAAYLIPKRKTNIQEILIIGVMASLTFIILDIGSEPISIGARFGSGFGIGMNLIKPQV